MATGYLGLGSNVGDRRAQPAGRGGRARARGVRVLASSSTYDTDPVGEVIDQPAFLNACVRIETDLEPRSCSTRARRSRRALGRDLRPAVRHGPRPIDVDLLLLGDARTAPSASTLPHAQVQLAPLRADPAARAGLRR